MPAGFQVGKRRVEQRRIACPDLGTTSVPSIGSGNGSHPRAQISLSQLLR